MFQNARRRAAKEQELEMLRQREAKLGAMTQAVSRIGDYNNHAMDIFKELAQEQLGLDQELAPAAEYIRKLQKSREEREEQGRQLEERKRVLAKSVEEARDQYHKTLAETRSQEQEMQRLAEQSRNFANPAGFFEQTAKDTKQSLEQMEEELARMQEFGQQMGVLSLDAAIEAGRMGDSGRRFVLAAEEVRSYAGRYQEAAGQLTVQVAETKEKLKEAQKEIVRLQGLLQENNVSMEKLSQALLESLSRLEKEKLTACGAEGLHIIEEIQKTMAPAGEQEEYLKRSLQQMERAGECYIKEQQAAARLKEQWEKVQLEVKKVQKSS